MKTSHDTRRRFEQWARNPHCQANVLSAVHGVPMADVATAEGVKAISGQSPFALARGQTFERELFLDTGKRLREELARRGVLPQAEATFVDFRMRRHGGPYRNLDAARAATTEWLRGLAAASAPESWLAAGATVRIPCGVMLPEAMLVIDALVAVRNDGGTRLSVGEIKTYPDRGGYTDPAELATARAQAGVYVHGLDLVLAELSLGGNVPGKVSVSRRGFLVLSRPGSNFPSVRANEDLRYQAERARRGFAHLQVAAEALPAGAETLPVSTILEAETCYSQDCLSFCERVDACHERAVKQGNPAILGDDVGRFLGSISLDRAVALLGGARPASLTEKEVARRLRDLSRVEELE